MKEGLSYSAMLKSELSHFDKSIGRHCLISELYAVLKISAFVIDKKRQPFIYLNTDNVFFACRFFKLLDAAFGFKAEAAVRTSSKSKKRHYILSVSDDNAARVLNAAASSMVLKLSCCKQAYLRSVFLAGASVSDPNKNNN